MSQFTRSLLPSVKGTSSVRYIEYTGPTTNPSIEIIDTYGVNVALGKQLLTASPWEVDLGSEYEIITIVYTRQAGANVENGSTIALMNSFGLLIKTITLKGNLGREVVDLRVAGNAITPVYGPVTSIVPYFQNIVRTRYIRLENPGMPLTGAAANTISLLFSQIAAFDILNRNVVVGKATSSADTAAAGTAFPVDGTGLSRPPAQSYQSVNVLPGSWWEVDLGKEYSLLSLAYSHTDLTATTSLQPDQVTLETLTANLPIVLYNSQRQEMKRVFLQKINTSRTNLVQQFQLNSYTYSGLQQVLNAGTTVRYIQLLHSGNFLQITQIMAIDNRGMNVAVGKATRASSTMSVTTGTSTTIYQPYNAVNGLFNTTYQSATNGLNWWEVDLGKEYDITSVIYFNSPTNAAYATGIRVHLYNAQRECVYQSAPLTNAAKQIIDLRPGTPTTPPCDVVPAMGLGLLTRYIEVKKSGDLGCCQLVALDSLGRNQALNKSYKLNGGAYVTGSLTNGRMVASLTNTISVTSAATNTILVDLGEEHEIIHVTGYAKPRSSAGVLQENPAATASFDTSLSGATVTLYNGCMQQVGQKTFSTESASWNMTVTPRMYGDVLYTCNSIANSVFDGERSCAQCGSITGTYIANQTNLTCNSCPTGSGYNAPQNTCIDTVVSCGNINTIKSPVYKEYTTQALMAKCEGYYWLKSLGLPSWAYETAEFLQNLFYNPCAVSYTCTNQTDDIQITWMQNAYGTNPPYNGPYSVSASFTKSHVPPAQSLPIVAKSQVATQSAYGAQIYGSASPMNTASLPAHVQTIPNSYVIKQNTSPTKDQYMQVAPTNSFFNLNNGQYVAATYCETLDFTNFIAARSYPWTPFQASYPPALPFIPITTVAATVPPPSVVPLTIQNPPANFNIPMSIPLFSATSPAKWLQNGGTTRLGYCTVLPFTDQVVDSSSNILYVFNSGARFESGVDWQGCGNSPLPILGLMNLQSSIVNALSPTNVQIMYYPDSAIPIQQQCILVLRSTTTSNRAYFILQPASAAIQTAASATINVNGVSATLFTVGTTRASNFLLESPTYSYTDMYNSIHTTNPSVFSPALAATCKYFGQLVSAPTSASAITSSMNTLPNSGAMSVGVPTLVNSIQHVACTGNGATLSSYITTGTPLVNPRNFIGNTSGAPVVGEIYCADIVTTIPEAGASSTLRTLTYSTYYVLVANSTGAVINPSRTPSAYTTQPMWDVSGYAFKSGRTYIDLWIPTGGAYSITLYNAFNIATQYSTSSGFTINLPRVSFNNGYSNSVSDIPKYYYMGSGRVISDYSAKFYASYNWGGRTLQDVNPANIPRFTPAGAHAIRITVFPNINSWPLQYSVIGVMGADACYDAAAAATLMSFGNNMTFWNNVFQYISTSSAGSFVPMNHWFNTRLTPQTFSPFLSALTTATGNRSSLSRLSDIYKIPTSIANLYSLIAVNYFNAAEKFKQLAYLYPTINLQSIQTYTDDVPTNVKPIPAQLYNDAVGFVTTAAVLETQLLTQGWATPGDIAQQLIIPFMQMVSDPNSSTGFTLNLDNTATYYNNMFDFMQNFPFASDGTPYTTFSGNFANMIVEYNSFKRVNPNQFSSTDPQNPVPYLQSYFMFPLQGITSLFTLNSPLKRMWGQQIWDFGQFTMIPRYRSVQGNSHATPPSGVTTYTAQIRDKNNNLQFYNVAYYYDSNGNLILY